MVSILVREFQNSHVIESDTYSYIPSKYFPFPMKNALSKALSKSGYIRSSDYILCPIYSSKDFQIGVTGSIEEKESSEYAISRELGEEIGLVPKNITDLTLIKKYIWERSNRPKSNFFVYELYIKHSTKILEHQHQAILSKNPDTSEKVGCFVYGDKIAITNFLNNPKIYVYKSSDQIVGIAAIRADKILSLYPT